MLSFFLIFPEFNQIYVNMPLMLVWRRMRLLGLLAVPAVLVNTLGNVNNQQRVRKVYHVVDVRGRRPAQVKTAVFVKVPMPLLLTLLVHITTEYLPKVHLREG